METPKPLAILGIVVSCGILYKVIRFLSSKKPPFGIVPQISWSYWFIVKASKFLDLFPFSVTRRKISVEDLYEQVRKETGLSDFGDDRLCRQALECYFDDIWNPKHLGPSQYRFFARFEALKVLKKRVKVIDMINRNPEIENIELPNPFIIIGMPRTGSTILHNLLAQDPKCRTIKSWEWNYPVPPSNGADTRKEDGKKEVERIRKIVPFIERVHLTEAHEADECQLGWIDYPFAPWGGAKFYPEFEKSINLFWNGNVSQMYEGEKKIIKTLLFQDEKSYSWMMLKSPLHTIVLDHLADSFHGSTLIWTHRDLKSILCSFSAFFIIGDRSDETGYIRMEKEAQLSLQILKDWLYRGLETRKVLESKGVKFVDFYFSDFMKDPIQSIEKLYEDLGMEYTEEAKECMLSYYQESLERRKKKKKPFRFTLEELNITKEEVDQHFSDYYAQFPRVLH